MPQISKVPQALFSTNPIMIFLSFLPVSLRSNGVVTHSDERAGMRKCCEPESLSGLTAKGNIYGRLEQGLGREALEMQCWGWRVS